MSKKAISIMKKEWFVFVLAFIFALSGNCFFEREASAAARYLVVVQIKAGQTIAKEGVTIEVTGENSTTPKTATTNKNGFAIIRGLPKGTYTITPLKEGYAFSPSSKEITFTMRRINMVLFTSEAFSINESCLGCHGDPGIGMIVGAEAVPLYVDAEAYAQTAHGSQDCTTCHLGFTAQIPHNAQRTYGSWARFSLKNTDTTKSRNFYVVSAEACLACHTDEKYAAMPQSEHGTIKDMKYNADGSPRVEITITGSDGQDYHANENFDAADCERCHINTNCGTCHWKTKITQKQEGNVLDLWTNFDSDSDTAKGAMTEYGMDWTVNVASHEFRNKEELTASNEVCQACHIGYYQGDKSVPAIGLQGIGIRRHPQVQELALSAARGIHGTFTCAACHTDVHEMVYTNTEHGARTGGKTLCSNCHADKAITGPIHANVTCIACHDAELGVHLDGEKVYPMALKHNLEESWPSHNLTLEVNCEKCHFPGNTVGAPGQVTPIDIHP